MLSAIEYRYQPSDSVRKEPFCQPGQKYSLKSNHIYTYIYIYVFRKGFCFVRKNCTPTCGSKPCLAKFQTFARGNSMQFTDQVKLAIYAIAQPSRPLSTLHGRIQKRAGTLQIVSTSFLIYSTGTRNILQNPLRNRMILQCMFIILWFLMSCAYTDTMCMLCIRSYISIWLCIFTGVWGVWNLMIISMHE